MPSTLNSQANGSVENGADTTPVPTETNDNMNSSFAKALRSTETPIEAQQNNIKFLEPSSRLNDYPKNVGSQFFTSSQFPMHPRLHIAPLHVECDPVCFVNLFL